MTILLALAAAAAPPADTPRGFMERLYANYRHSDYSPFTRPDRVFAPRLLAAINEDSKLAKGEVGYLDGDPVCQCQDSAGMHPSIVGVTGQGHGKATVRVSIGWDGEKPRPARFSLVRTPGGWRIADVSSADEPSLLGALEKSNRELRAKPRH
jgi:uncharacterized protein DUF3828